MDAETLREYALAKPGAWADNPWHEDHPVAKVGAGERGKIFAFFSGSTVGVKAGATREIADEWLLRYPDDASVLPYIGRSGWNSLNLAGAIPDDELLEAVDESYRMVTGKLPQRLRPAGWDA